MPKRTGDSAESQYKTKHRHNLLYKHNESIWKKIIQKATFMKQAYFLQLYCIQKKKKELINWN